MKKVIVALAALFVALSAHAQFGIVAGLTSSKSDVQSAYADIKNVSQYHVGVTYKLGLGNLFAIQPSLLYNMKGTALGDITGISGTEVDYKTGFIEVPVQLQVGVGLGDLARVYGFAEPFIGYAVSNKVVSGSSTSDTWDNVKNKLEYGVGLGIGAELIKHVQVSVKYFWNMGNVYGSDITIANITSTIGESKCNGVAASVAILF